MFINAGCCGDCEDPSFFILLGACVATEGCFCKVIIYEGMHPACWHFLSVFCIAMSSDVAGNPDSLYILKDARLHGDLSDG